MICEKCQTREARVSVTVVTGQQTQVRHLCPKCAAEMRAEMADQNVGAFLSSLFGMMQQSPQLNGVDPRAVEEPDTETEPEELPFGPHDDRACPNCRIHFGMVRKDRLVGCEMCYTAFDELLTPMLSSGDEAAMHIGRRPLRRETGDANADRQEELRREMAALMRVSASALSSAESSVRSPM